MKKKNQTITGAFAIALGVLFIAAQNKVIQIALSVLGAALLIMAIIDYVNKETFKASFLAVGGISVIVFGWVFIDLALYLISAFLLLIGIVQLILMFKIKALGFAPFNRFLAFAKPIATVIAGACLLFNKDGTLAWLFVIAGILITVEGILLIVDRTGTDKDNKDVIEVDAE